MSTNWQDDVNEFRKKFGLENSDKPSAFMSDKERILYISLIEEEVNELVNALVMGDIVEIADGGIDSIYVILGALSRCGITAQPIWDEIQKTNMAKDGGSTRNDGKILKPEGWVPPDVAGLIQNQVDGG